MFQISIHDLIVFFLSFFGGGGLGFLLIKLFIKSEAHNALEQDIETLKKEDKSLHERINTVEREYVTCKFCNMQHTNLSTTLKSMDRKLDILIEKKGERH